METWIWVLIAVAAGIVLGFVVSSLSRRGSASSETAPASTLVDDDLADVEGSRGSNIAFIVIIVAVLAFLITWLCMAVFNRGFFGA